MIWNLYRYRVKRLFMDRNLLFGLILFPILLGTFFWMTFSDITEKSETIDKINVAVVDDGTYENETAFQEFLDNVSGEEGYLNLEYVSKEKAQKKLKQEKVDGIVFVSEKISIELGDNGLSQTILKSILDSYLHNEKVIMDIIEKSPEKVETVLESLYSEEDYNKEVNASADGNMDVYVQYYFALFAMVCMFGANYGLKNTEEIQGGQSDVAVRRCVSPTKKMLLVFTDFLAAMTIQMLIFVIVFAYLNLFLGIDFGNSYGYILLSGFLSGFAGISYGYFIGVFIRGKAAFKEAIVTATTLFMCFLSGLMVGNVKNLVENTAPFINRINPAAVISDSFYALAVFGDMKMYLRCILTLLGMGIVFSAASVLILRRSRID